ncbi:MAG: hypothetical protein NVS3B3_20090 [Aquirhabdus sp.]
MIEQTNLNSEFYAHLKSIENILIPHTHFKRAVSRLQHAIEFTRQGVEPRNTFLVGESGAGKTWLVEYFASLYPGKSLKDGYSLPVLIVPTPTTPTLKTLGEAILLALGDPLGHRGTAFDKRERALNLMKKREVEFILFDEFHHFLDHGKYNSLISVTDWLKRFIDDAHISCALMGLPRCELILNANEQLRRRFSSRLELPAFTINTDAELRDFRAVVHEIDKALPTEKISNLAEKELAKRLYYASNGLIGYLRKLITEAFEIMVSSNQTTLTPALLEQAFCEVIWHDCGRALNPFNMEAKPRKLDRIGEPFAIATLTTKYLGTSNS